MSSGKATRFNPLAKAQAAIQNEPVEVSQSVRDTDAGIYGSVRDAEQARGASKLLSIFDIAPDPTQPRRAVPNAVRVELSPDATPKEVLEMWVRLCESGHDAALRWVMGIMNGAEGVAPEKPGPIEAGLIAVLQLARSIQEKGLINPITVVKMNGGYIIETGERRWWAYHVLHNMSRQNEQWSKIPARVVDTFDRVRQANENTQRGDLNMIAKTRQWALLMMAQHEATQAFMSYDDCPSDRDFYAQVSELYALDGAVIRNACGVTSDAALSRYRGVLRLSPDQWLKADDEGWGRSKIEAALPGGKAASATGEKPPLADPVNKRAFTRLWSAAESGRNIDPKDIIQVRRWLDELERSSKK